MRKKLTPEQQRLVEENLRLAYSHARNNRAPAGMDYEEWEAECLWRLCLAAGTFDPSLGWKFSTYAIRCFQSGWIAVNTHQTRECRDWRRMSNLGERDTWAVDPKPLLDPLGQVREQLRGLLALLSEKEREVLQGRANGLILGDIGAKLGVTRERVRQIQAMALAKLGRHVVRAQMEYAGD